MKPTSTQPGLLASGLLLLFAQTTSAAVTVEAPLRSHVSAIPKHTLRSMHQKGDVGHILQAAFALYGMQTILLASPASLSATTRVDISDADLAAMGRALAPLTHCFFVPVGKQLILALPDDDDNRKRFSPEAFSLAAVPNLSNLAPDEQTTLQGLLSEVFGIKSSLAHPDTVGIRSTPALVLQATDTLHALYRPPAQVILLITSYIDTVTHDRNLGVELPQSAVIFNIPSEAKSLISANSSVVSQLIAAGAVTAGDTLGIAAALVAAGYGSGSVLGSSSLYFGGGTTATGIQVGATQANAKLTSSSTHELQQVTLHLTRGQVGKVLLGERYPVLTASTTALSTSTNATSTPTIQYEDLGVTLEATPTLISRKEVSLHLRQVVRALHGTALNGIPILDNQELMTDLRVPAGATTMLVSNVTQTQALATYGAMGAIPTDSSRVTDESKLIITITPLVTSAGEVASLTHTPQ